MLGRRCLSTPWARPLAGPVGVCFVRGFRPRGFRPRVRDAAAPSASTTHRTTTTRLIATRYGAVVPTIVAIVTAAASSGRGSESDAAAVVDGDGDDETASETPTTSDTNNNDKDNDDGGGGDGDGGGEDQNNEDTSNGDWEWDWSAFLENLKPQDENEWAVTAIMGANVLVWGLWRGSRRHALLRRFMLRHFTCSFNGIVHHLRFHTLLTAAFSHETIPHLAINMFVLSTFAPPIMAPIETTQSWFDWALATISSTFSWSDAPQLLPTQDFLRMYCNAAIASSSLSVLWSQFWGAPATRTIGASGAVMGVLAAFCMLFPEQRVFLFGFIEMSASEFLQFLKAISIFGMACLQHRQTDHAAHFGGLVMGIATYKAEAIKEQVREVLTLRLESPKDACCKCK